MSVLPKLGAIVLALAFCSTAEAQVLNDLKRAAENGDPAAEFNLGQKYAAGDGLEKNSTKAFCWTHRSAEHGHAWAWLRLGMMYGMGEGVKKDNIESYKWFHLINVVADPNWGTEIKQWAAEDASDIAKQMSLTQVQQAKQRTAQWMAAVIARGHLAPNQQYVPFPGDKPPC